MTARGFVILSAAKDLGAHSSPNQAHLTDSVDVSPCPAWNDHRQSTAYHQVSGLSEWTAPTTARQAVIIWSRSSWQKSTFSGGIS